LSEESRGSDSFFIIAIIIIIVVIISFNVSTATNIITTIINWILGIIITIIILVLVFFLYKRIKRKKKLNTSVNIPIDYQKNETSISRKESNQIGIVEIISLPNWADVSGVDSSSEMVESNFRQLQATESFIRNCLNIGLPFGMILSYDQSKSNISFWASAIGKSSTNDEILNERILQLNDFLHTNFPGITTKCYLISSNPIDEIVQSNNLNDTNKTVILGSEIYGEHFTASESSFQPFLNEFHSFFSRKENPQDARKGCLIFACYPETQSGITQSVQKWFVNKKYKNISQGMQQSFSNNQLFSSGKISTTQYSIHHNERLQRTALEFEKSKATILYHTSILLCCAGSAKTSKSALRKAESIFKRAKGTLSWIVNPNSENSYKFRDLSREELHRHLSKIFLVDAYTLPNSSKCLSQELALLMRMPNRETGLQITREERSFLPKLHVDQPTANHFQIGFTRTLDDEVSDGTKIYWKYKNLLKHTFITGATGAGKTFSICHLIKQAHQANIPAIVFDFGKGELFPFIQQFIPETRVFTIGDDSICPIRINPLECPEWTSPQHHFDNIKWILDSALPQFEPLPIVTYRSLSSIYSSDGWDLAKGRKGKTRTLKDLHLAGLKICDEAGYADEVYHNMKGAWEMRIGSLMEGTLGRQLYTDRSITMPTLTEKTTVLEIRTIESTAQKIITLTLLTQLFDYYKSLGPTNSDKPRILIVLDEAESIFSSAEVFGNDIEMVTAAYNAVQKLNMILRQGRSYGIAVIIATQSPTNVSHEIIANTENKLIHRTHHGKDKRVIQEALELTNTQTAKLSSLKPGECYAVDGENEFPYFLKVLKPEIAAIGGSEKNKSEVMKKQMEGFYRQHPWMKEFYQPFLEEEFERTFDRAISEVRDRMRMDPYTKKRIELVLNNGVFQKQIQDLVREYLVNEIERRTFYEELLAILHKEATKVIGENKEDLRPAAMELITKSLETCSFLDNHYYSDILTTTRELVFEDGGR